MNTGRWTPSIEPPAVGSPTLWLVACLFFRLGDTVTTGVGLALSGVAESNPVVTGLVQQAGIGAFGALKVLTLAGWYLVWKRMSDPYRVGVPLALATTGVAVTAWNLHVLVGTV